MKTAYQIVLLLFLWTCHQHPLVSGRPLDVPRPHKFKSRQRRHVDIMKQSMSSSSSLYNGEDTMPSLHAGGFKSSHEYSLIPLTHLEMGDSSSHVDIQKIGSSRDDFEPIWQEIAEGVNRPRDDSFLRKKSTVSPASAKPTKPTKAPKPTKPTKAPKPTKPTKAPKPTKPTKPTKTPKPPKPTKPTEPEKPTKPTKPTKPPKPTKPSKPEIIESTSSSSTTTKDPMVGYCEVACEQGLAGPECDCPGHPIG